jgi:hypothetical protein
MMLTDVEFLEFRQAFEHELRQEITAGGARGYTLYGRKRDMGDHAVFVPPEAYHLFERLPAWKARLRHHESTPDLTGFKALPIRWRAMLLLVTRENQTSRGVSSMNQCSVEADLELKKAPA